MQDLVRRLSDALAGRYEVLEEVGQGGMIPVVG